MLERYKTSRRGHLTTLFVMFAIMLIFNILTKRVADDFMYIYSFVDDKRLDSLGAIIESLIQHGKEGNGRYFAHFFACVFLVLPDIVFDLVNSAIFVAVVYMIYKIAHGKREVDNIFLCGIFGLIWLFQLDFGQVCLWLDGSCNYLFGVFFGLLFILPYLRSVKDGKNLHPVLIIPHIAVAVILGGYLEPLSVGFIAAAALLLAADLFYFKNLRSLTLIPAGIGSLFGLAIMAFAPGEITNKLSGFQFLETLAVIGVSLLVLAAVSPIIILYVVLFKRARAEGVDKRILITSLIIAAGALISNLIMLIATYYPLRCSVAVVFMSILATAILWCNVENRDFGKFGSKLARAFCIVLAAAMLLGAIDVSITYATVTEHEEMIEEAIENGEDEIELSVPIAVTRYNAMRGLMYLDTSGKGNWPDKFLARYYGIGKITGRNALLEFLGLE